LVKSQKANQLSDKDGGVRKTQVGKISLPSLKREDGFFCVGAGAGRRGCYICE